MKRNSTVSSQKVECNYHLRDRQGVPCPSGNAYYGRCETLLGEIRRTAQECPTGIGGNVGDDRVEALMGLPVSALRTNDIESESQGASSATTSVIRPTFLHGFVDDIDTWHAR